MAPKQLSRLTALRHTLDKKRKMKADFVAFMQNIFDHDQAGLAPLLKEWSECWYLPIFGVYHPQKPDKIRVIFDSSTQHQGISLNDVLLTGLDLNNSLLGVLLRFRREPVTVVVDIEQMFHSFIVREDNRDFLRFLWFKGTNPGQEIVEYRMKVHIFGNSPSPAVTIYRLHRAAEHGAGEHGVDAKHFVKRDFYVDDGLTSFPSATEAVDLLTRTQKMLAASNLRLHKMASNCSDVLKAFPEEDHAKGLENLDFNDNSELKHDMFTFRVTATEKPFTRRGVLAVSMPFGWPGASQLVIRPETNNCVQMCHSNNFDKIKLCWRKMKIVWHKQCKLTPLANRESTDAMVSLAIFIVWVF